MKELRCVSDETDNPRTSIISHQTEEGSEDCDHFIFEGRYF